MRRITAEGTPEWGAIHYNRVVQSGPRVENHTQAFVLVVRIRDASFNRSFDLSYGRTAFECSVFKVAKR